MTTPTANTYANADTDAYTRNTPTLVPLLTFATPSETQKEGKENEKGERPQDARVCLGSMRSPGLPLAASDKGAFGLWPLLMHSVSGTYHCR